MGVQIVSVGSVAPWYTKVLPPVTRGLEGWYCLDTALDRIAFNRAPGKKDAVIKGTPVVSAAYSTFTGGQAWLDTGIADTAEATFFAICKANALPGGSSTTTAIPYVGNTGAAGMGAELYCGSDTTLNSTSWRTASGSATSDSRSITETPTTWGLRVLKVGGNTGNTELRNLTSGARSLSVLTGPRILSAAAHLIGGTHAATFTGKADISAVAVYSVALSDAEIDAIAAVMRRRAARLGIVV